MKAEHRPWPRMNWSGPPLSPGAHLRMGLIQPLVLSLGPASILEVGVGMGGPSWYLAERARYVGYEPDQEAHNAAMQRLVDREDAVVHNSLLPAEASREFDLVAAFEVLEHVEDDKQLLAHLVSFLHPGGHAVVSVPANPERFGAYDRFVGHHRRYERSQLESLFRAVGLVDISIMSYGMPLGFALEFCQEPISRRRAGARCDTGASEPAQWPIISTERWWQDHRRAHVSVRFGAVAVLQIESRHRLRRDWAVGMSRADIFKWSRRVVGIVSLIVLIVVIQQGLADGMELPDRTLFKLLIAAPISTIGLASAGASWAALAGGKRSARFAEFGTALPLRHLPLGGIGQVAGMAGLSVAGGRGPRESTHAGLLFMLATAAGASLVATPVVWDTSAPQSLRVLVGVAALTALAVLLFGSRALTFLSRVWPHAKGKTFNLRTSIAWSALAALCVGLVFYILSSEWTDPLGAIAGFSTAWLSGFLFVIAPAGLGAREGVLVVLWSEVDPAVVVATSLLVRLSTLVGEGVIFLVSFLIGREGKAAKEEELLNG